MSKNNKKLSEPTPKKLLHYTIRPNPGVFSGSKYVKKAGMTIEYINYNTPRRTDVQKWIE